MLSIVICSRRDKIDQKLEANIKSTIGCHYEIIWVDNSLNNYSIFEAYNYGAKQSKYDLICFMHEDICFKTLNWGRVVSKILNNGTVGVLGVAGALIKTKSPSPWWIANGFKADDYLCYNIIQKRKNGLNHEFSNTNSIDLTEVIVLDGVWLCCRKDVWYKARFDSKSFDGFHFYDLDFCMQVRELGLKNFVIADILIEHHSTGVTNKDWVRAAYIFHQKWEGSLPVSVKLKEPINIQLLENQALKSFLWLLVKLGKGSLLLKLGLWVKQHRYISVDKDSLRQLYSIFKYHNKEL